MLNHSKLDSKYLWIIVFPVAVVLTGELIIAFLAAHPTITGGLLSLNDSSGTSATTEAALRLRMLGLFMLLVFGALAVMVRFELERRYKFDQRTGRILLLGAGICLLVGVVIQAFPFVRILPRSFDVLGSDLFARAFEFSDKFPNWPAAGSVDTVLS